MNSDEELLHIFNKRDLWISGAIASGTLACVIAILIPITAGNELVPEKYLFIVIGVSAFMSVISLAKWYSWNKRAHQGIGSRHWMRSSM